MPRSESARERCTILYYTAWLQSSRGFLTPKNTSRDPPVTEAGSLRYDEAKRKMSQDKTLVAFAQLGCLRLNCKRGLVTLISSSTSYILSEATKSISLLSGGQHAAGDELWFGTASIPRSHGVSQNALFPPLYTARSSSGESYTAPALVINDLSLDERFSDKEYVGNGASWYAGVPITTRQGVPIGVYTVTDDKAREGLSIEELQFMQDIASTVMDHLESICNDIVRYRGERMVLGLGAFTEGQNSMDPNYKDHHNTDSKIEAPTQASAPSLHRSIATGITITELDPHASFNDIKGKDTSPDGEDADKTHLMPSDTLWESRQAHPEVLDAASASIRDLKTAPQSLNLGPSSDDAPPKESVLETLSQSSVPIELRQTFARAANILRQATSSDGVMFFNADSANVGYGSRAAPAFFRNDSNDTTTSSDDHISGSGGSGDDMEIQEIDYLTRPTHEHGMRPRGYGRQSTAKKCEMLGCSFGLSSVAKLNSENKFVLKEDELRRFVRRYPQGLVMHFSADGDISSSDDTANTVKSPTASRHGASAQRRRIASELFKVVHHARSIIWLPLWDFSKGRWSAGAFVCKGPEKLDFPYFLGSSRPERLLHAQGDLIYIKAFANTVMTEIQRLESVISDQAKMNVVANISHELRSPLHGILGSIEFLQDTAVDAFQASMITTVETCGKTLLDTVNHVLDFAKLSKRSQKGLLRNDSKAIGATVKSNLEMDVDLATLVEEVVEAIYAGQTFRSTGAFHGNEDEGAMISSLEGGPPARPPLGRTESKFAGSVRLLLDIERRDSWYVRTQPGAVRRIVMNLLGNALKYTEEGSVCVSLQSIKRSCSPSSLSFCITVADTGKGMSTDFAKNHAWEAFSQEDSFANGVGLGLSIVRHITSSLGGKIDLQSSIGKGTEMKVLLTSLVSSTIPDDSQTLTAISQRISGLTLCILDPRHSMMANGPNAELSKRTEDTLRRLATTWFGMIVVRADSIVGVEADFFIYNTPPSTKHMLEKHGAGTSNTHVPLIIITSNAYESANLRKEIRELKEMGRNIDVISQPCGPRKLARTFERCIYREPFTASSEFANTSLAAVRINQGPAVVAVKYQREAMSGSDEILTTNALQGIRTTSALSDTGSNMPTETLSESVGNSTTSGLSNDLFSPALASNGVTSPGRSLNPVLLVDDNEINLKLLVAFVQKAKYPYSTAENGHQAVQKFKDASKNEKSAFRAIVIDIQMPIMDGLTATKHIRSYETKKRVALPVTIVALTGLASKQSQNEAFEAGVDHFLAKPVKFRDFMKLLEQ